MSDQLYLAPRVTQCRVRPRPPGHPGHAPARPHRAPPGPRWCARAPPARAVSHVADVSLARQLGVVPGAVSEDGAGEELGSPGVEAGAGVLAEGEVAPRRLHLVRVQEAAPVPALGAEADLAAVPGTRGHPGQRGQAGEAGSILMSSQCAGYGGYLGSRSTRDTYWETTCSVKWNNVRCKVAGHHLASWDPRCHDNQGHSHHLLPRLSR